MEDGRNYLRTLSNGGWAFVLVPLNQGPTSIYYLLHISLYQQQVLVNTVKNL
jgi:hypothetical protein